MNSVLVTLVVVLACAALLEAAAFGGNWKGELPTRQLSNVGSIDLSGLKGTGFKNLNKKKNKKTMGGNLKKNSLPARLQLSPEQKAQNDALAELFANIQLAPLKSGANNNNGPAQGGAGK